jgi:GTPase Era involved in 16S rRNA processing
LDDIEIIVYDTPGLFDTSVDYNIIKKQLCHAVTSTASPGPHAFLIVLEAGRFTEEEQKTVQLINDMFGKDAGKYCILIITREDDILHHKLTLEKYIERSTAPFKNLLAQCQNRILAINNRAGEDEREKKVLQLITIVRKMLLENQSPYYTSDMFQQAEKELRQREEAVLNQAKEQMEEQKRAVRDEVRARVNYFFNM